MSANNPYNPPQANDQFLDSAPAKRSIWFWLPGFASSFLFIPMLFLSIGTVSGSGAPDFMLEPGFIITLTACSLIAALALYPFRSANWIVRAMASAPIGFVLFLAAILLLRAIFG